MKRVLPVSIPVFINTNIVANGKNYNGIIGNLSTNGAFVEIVPTTTVTPFIPPKKLDLKFQETSKKTYTLKCQVAWLYTKRNSSNNLISSIGVEIINPSPAYKKYFKAL